MSVHIVLNFHFSYIKDFHSKEKIFKSGKVRNTRSGKFRIKTVKSQKKVRIFRNTWNILEFYISQTTQYFRSHLDFIKGKSHLDFIISTTDIKYLNLWFPSSRSLDFCADFLSMLQHQYAYILLCMYIICFFVIALLRRNESSV